MSQRTRAIVAALALPVLLLGGASAVASDGSERPDPVRDLLPVTTIGDAENVGRYVAGVAYDETVATAAATDAVIVSYAAAVAESDRIAAEREAAIGRLSQPATRTAAPTSGATGACGGATNGADQFIARESGGNPGVYNSGGSGAWGCYQIMPGTWAGAGCDEFGAYGSADATAQAACASRLPMSAWGG